MRVSRVEINLSALQHNFSYVKQKVGKDVKIMAVVKDNAYGHGMIQIAKSLEQYGADYLAIAHADEGVILRQNGIKTPVLVLVGFQKDEIHTIVENELDVSIPSVEKAEYLQSELEKLGKTKANVHLKIDTGMGRIGVRTERAIQFIERACSLSRLNVVGLYSHFANSDEQDKSFAYYQLAQFKHILAELERLKIQIPFIHIANSAAVLEMPETYFSMVRPGIALYGIHPSREMKTSNGLKAVLSLKSTMNFWKVSPANTSISYGRRYFTKTATKIATVPIGYGDGYNRGLSNKAEVLIHSKRFPVVGTICMDQIMVDVGMHSTIHVGEDVVLIGTSGDETITAWELAEKLGTIPYEILTNISERVPRIIINDGKY
ncbi:MAG: alanine racemase [Ignavibacteriae bacterium]|nr:alanine racemase [Ignavibacteriota bacterium]